LLVDAAQCSAGPVIPVPVVNRQIGDPAGFLRTGSQPRLGQHQPIRDGLVRAFVTPFADHIGQKRDPGAKDELTVGGLAFGKHAVQIFLGFAHRLQNLGAGLSQRGFLLVGARPHDRPG
jgi:hypothetical protein